MGIIAKIAAFVLGVSFMVFVAFFGRLPVFRRTPISFIHRLMWVYIPNGVLALDQKLTGGRFGSSMARFGHFMMNDKHPTVMIFFILLMSISELIALPSAWPQLATFQRTTVSIFILLPYIFLYLSAYTDPGFITSETLPVHLATYPYDFTIFHPGAGAQCRTCDLPKPARSKHCPVCKGCISRLDHHCIFINNCVGHGNAHWFYYLLLSTAVLTLWGGLLCLQLVERPILARIPTFSAFFWRAADPDGAHIDFRRYLVLWAWALQQQVGLGAVGLLALLTTPLVWGLLAYNLYNVYCGVTTNESLKWSDLAEDMRDGIAFKRPLKPGQTTDFITESSQPQYRLRQAAWTMTTRWPVDPEQIVVRTSNGEPPPLDAFPGEGSWERVWKLKDVENLYDVGFWDNLADIFAPRSYFDGRGAGGRDDDDSDEGGMPRRRGGRGGGRKSRKKSRR